MLTEIKTAARQLAGLMIVLSFAAGAAAVVGLTLLAAGIGPGLAAAAALVTPILCGLALGLAVRSAGDGRAGEAFAGAGLAGVGASLAVAHALLSPGSA
jgi:hypothetical protein